MRLNFWLMVSSFILSFYSTQITALGASDLKLSCAHNLVVSIGEKRILKTGVFDEIASSYADAIWASILEIQVPSSFEEVVSQGNQIDDMGIKEKVMNEIDGAVYHKFVANLRSKHFLLGKLDRASNSIQELGLPQRGADLVLGLAVATPALAVIGASWIFFNQGDSVSVFGGLPPAAMGIIGAYFTYRYRAAEERIHNRSVVLSLQFRDLVTAKLGDKLLRSMFLTGSGYDEDQTRLQIEHWSKNRGTGEIIDAAFWWHFIKEVGRKKDVKAIDVDSN